MGSKTKRKTTSENSTNNNVIGKGKVTPVQVAFIVDRYLADSNFTKTRSVFRSEASSLISKSSLNEAPKSLLSLAELLDEYIWLKEQMVMLEQQKNGLAQEGCRIQTLLQGMQNVMNTYNNSAVAICTPSPSLLLPPVTSPESTPTASMPVTSSAGYPASIAPVMTSVSMTQSVTMDRANAITPISSGRPPRKRRNCSEGPPQAPKKIYSGPLANCPFPSEKVSKTVGQPSSTSSPCFAQVGLPVQQSTVAKALFDKHSQSPTSNSCDPKTPPQSTSPPNEKPTSSKDVTSTVISHHSTAPLETTPTNCTIISSKTIIVSPAKRYTIERNECTFSSPSKANFKRQNERDHVKGRLNFDSLENVNEDGSPTMSESENQGDIFDMDLPNFDAFGPDFSLSELLTEFGIGCENIDYPCSTTACASSDAILGSLHEKDDEGLGIRRDLVKHSSAVTEVVAADKAVKGSDSITSVKSVRKCIRIVSPSKSSRNSPVRYQENQF